MALSEKEQKLLDQLEAALAAEDPHLASTLRGTARRKLHRRHAALAGLGFLVGIVALVAGMQLHPALSIAGFVLMLASTIIAVSSWRYVTADEPAPATKPKTTAKPFMDKMEERWRKRMDGGA